jgi:predicted flap endonuclease-1-like 5' DNA nuclease
MMIGITNANLYIALNGQGILSIDDFASLEDKDIEQLCANIRIPGGMVTIARPSM